MPSAVTVEHVAKRFRVFHERNQYLKTSILRGRRARWEDFWALQNVSFDVNDGEAFGIIGHNGSGKSTLLKCLTGILTPDRGRVQVNGSMAALLELGAGFHPDLSGRENVFLNGAILGMSRRELNRRFDEIVAFAGLEEFIDQPVRNYSTGMTVRLGFSVAITVSPDVLIIDEILAVGDAEFQAKCRDKVAQFRREGRTIVLVSHSLSDVLSMCDRVLWLDHGGMRTVGDTARVLDEYSGVTHDARATVSEAGTRWGSGEARLQRLELIHPDGGPDRAARTGGPLTLRLHYEAYAPVDDAVIGIAVHHQSGQHVSGTNTRLHGCRIERLDGSGFVDYRIPVLPLLAGTYEVTAAIQDWTQSHDYDYWRQGLRFDVRPNILHEEGIASLGGTWSIDAINGTSQRSDVDS